MSTRPLVEVLSAITVIRELRLAVAAVDKESEATLAIQDRVEMLLKQCAFYERGMDSARGRIVRLLMAQLRHAEAAYADEYILKIDEALIDLKEKTIKKEGATTPNKVLK